MKKKNSPGCGCCGICSSHNPDAVQEFSNDFNDNLDNFTTTQGASIVGDKLYLIQPNPFDDFSSAYVTFTGLGCSLTNFLLDLSVEFHGVIDLFASFPQAGMFIQGMPINGLFGLENRISLSSGPVTFPNRGKYFAYFGANQPVEFPDTPVPGDVGRMTVYPSGSVMICEWYLNDDLRHTHSFPQPTQEAACNLTIYLQQNLRQVSVPRGPDYVFDNLIASLTCS